MSESETPAVVVRTCIAQLEDVARTLGLTSARRDADTYWGHSLVGYGMAIKGIASELERVAETLDDV
jgi:hypothetical protein